MDLTPEVKKAIDKMTFQELLYDFRFAPSSDERFHGESGVYFRKRMAYKRDHCPNPVKVSKKIGWTPKVLSCKKTSK